MTQDRAQRIIIGSAAVLLVISWAQDLAKGQPPEARPLLGAAFMAIALSIASEFAPDLAGMLAVLILVSVLVQIDPRVWAGLNKAVSEGVKLPDKAKPPIVNEDGTVASLPAERTSSLTPSTPAVPAIPN